MRITLSIIIAAITLSGCTATVGAFNKAQLKRDPVTGEVTSIYAIDLDNSTGSIFTAGSIGGKISIHCAQGRLKGILMSSSSGRSNGWLQVKFDNHPHYEIQGTNDYPYDRQEMTQADARRFFSDTLRNKKAIMKVGTHSGYHVMVAHLESLPKDSMREQCGS